MDNNNGKLSIRTLCNMLINDTMPLQEYIDDTLKLMERKEPSIQAFLPESNRRERLHSEAKSLQAMYPEAVKRPPLYGLLVGVKDLFNVDGLPTRAGSKLPAEAFSGKEAEVVTRLKQLGAIILGKTVSTEFAYFSPGETCNPVNILHTPGGSSSGSAAAVAAGYCLAALGTQTIASIIRPASYCGVFGYKPSWGRISTEGVFPFSQSADHVGFICRNHEDVNFLAKNLLVNWNYLNSNPEPSFGCATGTYLNQVEGAVKENFHNKVKDLIAKGYSVVECDPFAEIDYINTRHRRLIAAEFAINHKALFNKFSHLYSEHSKQLYALGLQVSASELIDLRNAQIALRENIISIMKKLDINLWITPSTTTNAPLGLESTGVPLMSLPWTNAGLPSITVPNGFDSLGLPFGLQIIGAWQEDEYLCSLGLI
ncbi:MAG: amidase [Candidatus Cloacimonetes bacterium]|nr:amidase [Candidatus Cloacimonadota bacterium]